MTATKFDSILDARIAKTRSVLGSKAGEYASDLDRLPNFKRAAALLGTTPAKALVGFLTKHLVSVLDIVDHDAAGLGVSTAALDEKVGDAVNYLILLEAVLLEKWKS